jgi:hypothetical protein
LNLAPSQHRSGGPYWSVPKAWQGETCFILGGGPSLRCFDVELIRDQGRVIVINDSYLLYPWADCLYFCDRGWLQLPIPDSLLDRASALVGSTVASGAKHQDLIPLIFQGQYRVSLGTSEFGTHRLRSAGLNSFSTDPTSIGHGTNSGYQAINLAFLFGAAKIILLGYDMHCQGGHHFHETSSHPANYSSVFEKKLKKDMLPRFQNLVAPLQSLGVEVINCTPGSALTCWPIHPLEEILLPSCSLH